MGCVSPKRWESSVACCANSEGLYGLGLSAKKTAAPPSGVALFVWGIRQAAKRGAEFTNALRLATGITVRPPKRRASI
jgi:hypothetical protein